MPTPNEVPIGVYPTPTGPIAAPAQAEVIALINTALALIPDPDAVNATTEGVSGEAPHYDTVWGPVARDLRKEFNAAIVAIDATPEA